MTQGRPGDHPVTDMLLGLVTLYDDEVDELFKVFIQKRYLPFAMKWWEDHMYHQPIDKQAILQQLQQLIDEAEI